MKTSGASFSSLLKQGKDEWLETLQESKPLWPAPYDEDTPESAWLFLLNLRTWNESEQIIDPFPDIQYLLVFCYEWHRCKALGIPLIVEKCRRMVVSWACRGLELHQMGLRRTDWKLGGEDFESAAKHCWRLKHYYEDLRRRFPQWKLPNHTQIRFKGEGELEQFALPNGSRMTIMNGNADKVQGEGVSGITYEEFTKYTYAKSMLAQAKILLQPSPGSEKPSGFVVCIGNACADNTQWQDIKKGLREDNEAEELMTGFHARMSKSGERYLFLQHFADPDKDDAWLEKIRLSMLLTPSQYQEQYLMIDYMVEGALWSLASIDATRVRDLPKDIVFTHIAVDPNVSDKDAAKDKNRRRDSCGIIIGSLSSEGHLYVWADLSGDYHPSDWSRMIVQAAVDPRIKASQITYENNQGGVMTEELMKMQIGGSGIRYKGVNARIGKRARAEPVEALYKLGVIHHVGVLPELEKEMCTWDHTKPGQPSPGRIDALVWLAFGFRLCDMVESGGESTKYKARGT